MTITDDGLKSALSVADPTRSDLPPAKGSRRYSSILEAAMRSEPAKAGLDARDRKRTTQTWWSTRRLALTAAAVVVVLAALTWGILRPGHEPSAVAAVQAAAAKTGGSQTLRANLTIERPDGSSSITRGEMNGPDVRIATEHRSTDGQVTSEAIIVVGDTMWETTTAGETTKSAVAPDDRLVAFGEACEAVLNAALRAEQVTDAGADTVRGTEAKHYSIAVDSAARSALEGLSPGELAWFELEYPNEVATIDVWVANGLVHRITVRGEMGTSTTDFYDFGANLTIQPPSEG